MNAGDTVFIMICTIFVFFMTPGLAIFYAGLVRKKNAVGIMEHCFIAIPIVSIIWAICGFSLAFGTDMGGFLGGFDFLLMKNITVSGNPSVAPNLPFILFFVFQLAFAIITPALIAGAVAERVSLRAYCIFIGLWSLVVYSPVIHMVWGGGILAQMGVLDFAGGLPIHLSAGASSYVAARMLGARINDDSTPCNMAYVAAGTGILWAGWFAFNGGSALAANSNAALAIANTLLASASGAFGWLLLSRNSQKKITLLDTLIGGVAGLIVITPMAGYVDPIMSLPVGIVGAMASFLAVRFRIARKLDDTLDVWALHGVAGALGVILAGVFANPDFASSAGIMYGNFSQVGIQAGAAAAVALYSAAATYILLKAISLFTPLRVSSDDEQKGLDTAIHSECLYYDK